MTVLFGGTFDPVHNGHVSAVRAITEGLCGIKRAIIMPAYINPFKQGAEQGASPEDRLAMCREAFGDMPLCEISDYEVMRSSPSYTYDTLMYLRERYPGERPVLALGSDTLGTLLKWYRAGDILAAADIAAVCRDREAPVERYAREIEEAGGRVRLIESEPFIISSTEIREMLARGEDVSGLIPERVAAYIYGKGLYDVRHR